MHGMANGLILAHSVFTDDAPAFIKVPCNNNKKVRHKSKKEKHDR
jgi:hypothetical protein